MKLIAHLHLVLRLKVSGAVRVLLCAFMVWTGKTLNLLTLWTFSVIVVLNFNTCDEKKSIKLMKLDVMHHSQNPVE
jgi:hypothetical protein